jgi:hypothetical protein
MNVFRAALTSDFWITGIVIVRYIPRAFRVKQVDGDLFFTEEKRQEYRRRVESVTPDSQRQWGTMEVDQMLHHLNLACGGSQGFYDLPDESYLTSRTVFKWILVDWYPEQPVGLRLPTGFKIPHSQRFEFAYEKSQLLKHLEADWNAKTADAWKPHPMFGKMTPTEWGKLLQIHVDYHLRQFAVYGVSQRPRHLFSAAYLSAERIKGVVKETKWFRISYPMR